MVVLRPTLEAIFARNEFGLFWRDNPSAYVAQRTGTPNKAMGDMDTVSISDEATVIAALQKGDVPGGRRNSDLLTADSGW